MATASSQLRTCSAPASASEYTATVAMPRRRQVAAMRQAISPRLAMRILRIFRALAETIRLHPEHAEARRLGRHAVGQRKAQPQHVACLRRLDDAVVPQPRRGIVGIALALVLLARLASQLGQLFLGHVL